MILSTLASGFQTEHANIFASPAGKVQTCILESSDVITIRGATNLCVTDMVLCRVLYVFMCCNGIFESRPFLWSPRFQEQTPQGLLVV